MLDLDGTMVNSVQPFIGWVKNACGPRNIRFEQEEEKLLRRFLGYPGTEALQRSLGVTPKLAGEIYAEISDCEKRNPPKLVSDAHRPLQYLGANGIAKGILTSRNRESALRTIYREGINMHFNPEYLRCSGDSEHDKPHPKAFDFFLEKFGFSKEEMIYVGDSVPDIECGKGAGIRTLVVLTGAVIETDVFENENDVFDGVPVLTSICDLPAWLNNGYAK